MVRSYARKEICILKRVTRSHEMGALGTSQICLSRMIVMVQESAAGLLSIKGIRSSLTYSLLVEAIAKFAVENWDSYRVYCNASGQSIWPNISCTHLRTLSSKVHCVPCYWCSSVAGFEQMSWTISRVIKSWIVCLSMWASIYQLGWPWFAYIDLNSLTLTVCFLCHHFLVSALFFRILCYNVNLIRLIHLRPLFYIEITGFAHNLLFCMV